MKTASTPATPSFTGGAKASMLGRRIRPQSAADLRRSRASPELMLGIDAPTPVRKASPKDSKRSGRQLLRPRRSQEERKQVCLAGGARRKGQVTSGEAVRPWR